VTGFTVERRGNNGTFRWTPATNHTSFNVEIENPVSGWKRNDKTYDNRYSLNSIDPGKTYRMRIQGVCNGNEESVSDFSGWQTLNIPEPQKREDYCPDCECKDPEPEPPITNFKLRYDLQPGDTIHTPSGRTRFILKTVENQGNGIYKGIFLFWAEIWNLKILCDYWDLSVNTDNQIVTWDFKSVYDPQFLVDVDAVQDYLNEVINAVNDLTSGENTPDTLNVDFTIPDNPEYYYDNEENTLVVRDDEGNSYTIDLPEKEDGTADLPATIQDKDGKVYNIDENGNIIKNDTEEKTKEEERTTEFAVFYKNIEFNPVDTLFVVKEFNGNINLTFKKQTDKQWKSVSAFWRMDGNQTHSESFNMENPERTDLCITAKQYTATKDSIVLFVKYLDIDIEREIIKTLLEIKNLETRFDNLVDSLDKALEREGWDKPLIMGADNKFVKRGMHEYFEETTEYEPCGFPIFDLFYQIYATDVLIAKYDGKYDKLIEQINAVMTKNSDGSYKIGAAFIQSVTERMELMRCQTEAEAQTRYKLMINGITIQNISANE
jgi:hypothetical protein